MRFDRAVLLSGPDALNSWLGGLAKSPSNLMPVAAHAVDVLLCYWLHRVQPSQAARNAIVAGITAYVDTFPSEKIYRNLLASLLRECVPKSEQLVRELSACNKNATPSMAIRLRAKVFGIRISKSNDHLIEHCRTLCIQLHRCDFVKAAQTLAVAESIAFNLKSKSCASTCVRLFLKQSRRFLAQIKVNAGSPEILWEIYLSERPRRLRGEV